MGPLSQDFSAFRHAEGKDRLISTYKSIFMFLFIYIYLRIKNSCQIVDQRGWNWPAEGLEGGGGEGVEKRTVGAAPA